MFKSAATLHREGHLLPLSELLRFEEIGPPDTYPEVSYPQAKALVRYMHETLGHDRFIALYRALRTGGEAYDHNLLTIERCFNKSIDQLERDWLAQLGSGG